MAAGSKGILSVRAVGAEQTLPQGWGLIQLSDTVCGERAGGGLEIDSPTHTRKINTNLHLVPVEYDFHCFPLGI